MPLAGFLFGVQLMELQSRRNNSGDSEALEPIEVPVIKGHQPLPLSC